MSLSPCSFTTALDESFALTVSLPVISCLTSTSLLFSRVRNLFLTHPHCQHASRWPYNIWALQACQLTYMRPCCKCPSQRPYNICTLQVCQTTYMHPLCKHA